MEEKTLIRNTGDSVKNNAINRLGTHNKGKCVSEKKNEYSFGYVKF